MSSVNPLPAIDWDAVTAETTALLADYIRLETYNPPGNEYLACDWLEAILRREGIASERYDAGGGRHSLRAIYRGDGAKRPLMLLHHSDTVPVEPAHWDRPPFAGLIEDGVLWGRGALDDKGLGAMGLMVLLLFKRLGLRSSRDLVFLAAADEEAGSQSGVEFLAREHPEVFDVEYVLNEGAFGVAGLAGLERPLFGFSAAEKSPLWVGLATKGTAGHGSVPLADNCVERLARAVTRIADWQRPAQLIPETAPLFETLIAAAPGVGDDPQAALATIAARSPMLRARLADSISVTTFNAGFKGNVIPSTAEASLDVRLLPGQHPEAFLDALRAVIADPEVTIETKFYDESGISPLETELTAVMRAVVRELVEDALFTPTIDAFFTDSRTFRRFGITAYGFNPVLLSEADLATIHGNNERLSIENIRLGTQILFEVVRRMCQ
jgi:acetylornithine deacetylase/succinyl-diaminopimelate desuccinylase-like protein